jgi:small-conductance mechanosensitive channel
MIKKNMPKFRTKAQLRNLTVLLLLALICPFPKVVANDTTQIANPGETMDTTVRTIPLARETDSARNLRLLNNAAQSKERATGYPIVPHRDTIFYIYTGYGSATPEERGEVISKRLDRLYQEFQIRTDSLVLQDNIQSVDVLYKDRVVVSVTDLDALWFGESKMTMAKRYKENIVNDIKAYKKGRSILFILKQLGLAFLVILMQVVIIRGLNFLFRGKINRFLLSKRGIWFKGIKIKNYEIVDQDREIIGIVFISKLIRWALIILLLYISIPILFSIFPPTQRIAETLFGYILTPLKKIGGSILNYIPELITIIVIVIITRYLLKFIKYLASEVQNERLKIPGFFPDWTKPTYNIIKVLILAFMFIVIFPYLPGSDSPVFKGVSVFLGIVFSLGSSSIIGNIMAGLVITYMRPFQIGDRIKIGDILGDVTEKTPFVTRLRTPKKEFITIPNSSILASSVVNYSTSKREDGIILHTSVTIGYDAPWRQVHQLLIEAALKTKYIKSEPLPFVLQTSLDDFYVHYQLNAHSNEPTRQPAIYSELHQNIQDGFNEAGVEILSPHYRSARDGNPMAIPLEYWPKDYKPGGFKIEKPD